MIAIIAILAAILFPVFSRAREQARKSSCLSNLKQIGTATIVYAQDYDEAIYRGYNTWQVALVPYMKSNQIFVCPSSSAPQPETRFYNNVDTENDFITGSFASNLPSPIPGSTYLSASEKLMPQIFGNYARNNEWVLVTGQAYLRLPAWNAPAQEILYAETRDGSEDDDSNDYDEDNAPYLEPDGTTWNQMWRAISVRHSEGSNVAYADGHVKWHRLDWFKTDDGKSALNWFMRDCPNGTGFGANVGCKNETPPF